MGLCECDVRGVFLRGYYFMYRVCDIRIDIYPIFFYHICDFMYRVQYFFMSRRCGGACTRIITCLCAGRHRYEGSMTIRKFIVRVTMVSDALSVVSGRRGWGWIYVLVKNEKLIKQSHSTHKR